MQTARPRRWVLAAHRLRRLFVGGVLLAQYGFADSGVISGWRFRLVEILTLQPRDRVRQLRRLPTVPCVGHWRGRLGEPPDMGG
jgi:hypothetical protein